MKQHGAALYLLAILFTACASDDLNKNRRQYFGYLFEQPAHIYNLPRELTEISGLQLLGNDTMACVQDEEGIIFIYHLERNQVVQKIHFGENRDYEGITLAGIDMYVAGSNGTLHFIRGFNSTAGKASSVIIKTRFSQKNNIEGICHDKENNRLLLALKDDPGGGLKGKKAIYAVDLQAHETTKNPVFIIDLNELADSLLQDPLSAFAYKIQKTITVAKSVNLFRPSAIAIHPLTGDIYILGSESRILVVLSENGKLKHVYSFQSSLFIQPEGITFADNGDLYISNEGNGRKANILKFAYAPKN